MNPYTFEYEVTHIVPGTIIKVDFRLGFKVEPRINLYFKQVLDDMEMNNEIDLTSRYESLRNLILTVILFLLSSTVFQLMISTFRHMTNL